MRRRCPLCEHPRQPDELRAIAVTIPTDYGKPITYEREACADCRRSLRLLLINGGARRAP